MILTIWSLLFLRIPVLISSARSGSFLVISLHVLSGQAACHLLGAPATNVESVIIVHTSLSIFPFVFLMLFSMGRVHWSALGFIDLLCGLYSLLGLPSKFCISMTQVSTSIISISSFLNELYSFTQFY